MTEEIELTLKEQIEKYLDRESFLKSLYLNAREFLRETTDDGLKVVGVVNPQLSQRLRVFRDANAVHDFSDFVDEKTAPYAGEVLQIKGGLLGPEALRKGFLGLEPLSLDTYLLDGKGRTQYNELLHYMLHPCAQIEGERLRRALDEKVDLTKKADVLELLQQYAVFGAEGLTTDELDPRTLVEVVRMGDIAIFDMKPKSREEEQATGSGIVLYGADGQPLTAEKTKQTISGETKYGFIADVHENPDNVEKALQAFEEKGGVDRIIVNGDIECSGTPAEKKKHVQRVLDIIGSADIDAFVQPGSHETIGIFGAELQKAIERNPRIVSALQEPVHTENGHTLLFVPGADRSRGEYQIGTEVPTGVYGIRDGGIVPIKDFQEYVQMYNKGLIDGMIFYQNINDIKQGAQGKDPATLIGISHVPLLCDGSDRVDHAEYVQDSQGRVMSRKDYMQLLVEQEIDGEDKEKEFKEKLKLEEKTGNVGSPQLAELFKALGITKAISSHIHESGHQAHTLDGEVVGEGLIGYELLYNTGSLDEGRAGIIVARNNEIRYQNIVLE